MPTKIVDQLAPISGPGCDKRRSDQLNKWPARYDDYLCYSTKPNDPTIVDCSSGTNPHQKRSSDMCYLIAHYVTSNRFSASYQNFLAASTHEVDPKYFQEAITDPQWRKVMNEKIEALKKNDTWTI